MMVRPAFQHHRNSKETNNVQACTLLTDAQHA